MREKRFRFSLSDELKEYIHDTWFYRHAKAAAVAALGIVAVVTYTGIRGPGQTYQDVSSGLEYLVDKASSFLPQSTEPDNVYVEEKAEAKQKVEKPKAVKQRYAKKSKTVSKPKKARKARSSVAVKKSKSAKSRWSRSLAKKDFVLTTNCVEYICKLMETVYKPIKTGPFAVGSAMIHTVSQYDSFKRGGRYILRADTLKKVLEMSKATQERIGSYVKQDPTNYNILVSISLQKARAQINKNQCVYILVANTRGKKEGRTEIANCFGSEIQAKKRVSKGLVLYNFDKGRKFACLYMNNMFASRFMPSSLVSTLVPEFKIQKAMIYSSPKGSRFYAEMAGRGVDGTPVMILQDLLDPKNIKKVRYKKEGWGRNNVYYNKLLREPLYLPPDLQTPSIGGAVVGGLKKIF